MIYLVRPVLLGTRLHILFLGRCLYVGSGRLIFCAGCLPRVGALGRNLHFFSN
jgi:hypothetical protein